MTNKDVDTKRKHDGSEDVRDVDNHTLVHLEGLKNVKDMFIGRHTIFSLLGATVGGVIVGRTIWEWSSNLLGLSATFFLGILIYAVSDYILDRFHG